MPGLTEGEPRSRLDDSDDESDLVHHVVCSRDRPDGAPEPPLRAGEAWWLVARPETPRTREMPARYEVVLRRMVEFSQDVTRHSELIDSEPNQLLARDIEVVIDQGTRAIAASVQRSRLPRKATISVARATALWALYGFAGLAGLCYITYGDLPGLGSDDLSVLGVHGVEHHRISRLATRWLAASLS